MTPNAITTLLAEPTGRQFDEPYKLMLFDRVVVWYEKLLRNSIDKDPRRRKEFFKAVVIPTERVFKNAVGVLLSETECNTDSSIDLSIGCQIVQTKFAIPATLWASGISYDYVGSADGTNPFSYSTSPSTLRFYQYNKYQNNFQRYYTNINNKIQVYDDLSISAIRIDGVFLNLKEYHECNCNATQSDFWNTNLDMANDILQQVIQYVTQEINPKIDQPITDEIKLRD